MPRRFRLPKHLYPMLWVNRIYQRSLAKIHEWLPDSYEWPHPVIFIAGLPKSGTTWMVELLAAVPAYHVRWPRDPDGCVYNHDVCEDVFANLPWNRHSVVKFHTRPTPANLQVIQKYNLRTVVMHRDLRDQCVSRYFHVLHDPAHRHYRYYREASREDGLSHSIDVTLDEYLPWVRGWMPFMTEQRDRFHEVRYENLLADTANVLSGVLAFYDIELPKEKVTKIVGRSNSTTKFDLRSNLRKGKGTARKGVVGDWRNHFTDAQVQRFKDACGDFLIELGYEQDLNWTL